MSNLFSDSNLKDLGQNIKWKSILRLNHLAGFDVTCYKCSICNKRVGKCQICYSASNLKDLWKNIKWKSILRLNHLAGFDVSCYKCSICNKTVSQCQICFLIQISKISCKTANENPYLDWTTWLALMSHVISVQYIIKQLVSVKFVILLQISKRSVKTF